MKKIILLISLLPLIAFAQMPPGFNAKNGGNMEKNMMPMMAGMEKMEKCMSSIDQNKIDEVATKVSKFEQDISMLCEQGKRAEAKNKTIQFSKDMAKDKALKKMEGCMEAMPFEGLQNHFQENEKHVCDETAY